MNYKIGTRTRIGSVLPLLGGKMPDQRILDVESYRDWGYWEIVSGRSDLVGPSTSSIDLVA